MYQLFYLRSLRLKSKITNQRINSSIMKRNTTRLLCLLAVAYALSCSKGKEPIQVEPPQLTPIKLTVTGLTSNDTLRNTLTAEIKAEHSAGIKTIEVFANDELIASTATADSLSLSWNTLDMPDGTYSMKVVVSDDAGNKKEQVASVVVSNVLLKINRHLLVEGDASAYFITDSEGQLISRADFVNDGTHDDVVSLYPTEAFDGPEINLTRVSTASYLTFPQIEHFVGIKRGTHLGEQSIQHGKGRLNEYQNPIPITLKNIPDHDRVLVSTNTLYYQFPSIDGYDYALPYTSGSKAMVLVERQGDARYGLFDIPDGSSKLELDAASADLVPVKKTIRFPAAVSNAYISAYGHVVKDYDEFYTFANKPFSGNSVDVFYPEDLVDTLAGTISYMRNGMSFSNYYFQGIPGEVAFWDIQAKVSKPGISDFEIDANGDFGYYRVLFENKPYVGTGEGYIEIAVFASPEHKAFRFPDIAAEMDIPGFNLGQFYPGQLQFYKYDVPSSHISQFSRVSSAIRVKDASQIAIATLSLR